MEIKVNWKHDLSFEGGSDEHLIKMDTTISGGGANTGLSPKQLLLASVCGCTGMDVVDMLEKMKVRFTHFEIIAEAEQTADHPKVFKYINLIYKTDVSMENKDKLSRAVELSQTKYCGVSIMLKKHCPVNYQIQFLHQS